jgi:ATP-binding cassette subfamily B multidrug efflux pump
MTKKEKISRFFHYIRDYAHLFVIGFLALVVVTAGYLAGPLILREIIDKGIPSKDMARMLRLALAYLGLLILSGVVTYFELIVIARLGLNVVTRIKKDVFEKLLTLPISYFDAHPVGELMARTESDSEKVKDLFSRIGIALAANVLFFGGMLAVCLSLEPRVTAWISVAAPFLLAFVFFFFDKLRVLYDKSRVLWAGISATVTEFVQGIEILKAFGRVPWAESRLEERALQKRSNDVKVSMLEITAMGALGFFIGPAFMAAVVVLVAPGILSGAMTMGTLLVFLEYGRRLFEPLMSIAENVRGIQQARVSLGRIFSILSLDSEEGSGLARPLPRLELGIEFRGVWFAYKDEDWVLKDVTFHIPKGGSIALVGPSGSGKTTTVGLLCRFYRPQRGGIYVDGRPLEELDLRSWRRMIGLVLQDVYLFPGPVLENVRVYDQDLGVERVRAALSAVQAADFVDRLPGGIAAEMRERGSNISAGEKQLLSFARAVAFEPSIVVLDEATASIDVKTERKIKEGMSKLLAGRTALIVAHRLSSVMSADQILFFKEGRVVARGRHEELLAAFEEYADLVRLQFPDMAAAEAVHG